MRCLAWISDHSILVGCLDGSVLLWEDAGGEGGRSDEPVMEVGKVEGSVIHMRLDGKHQVHCTYVFVCTCTCIVFAK